LIVPLVFNVASRHEDRGIEYGIGDTFVCRCYRSSVFLPVSQPHVPFGPRAMRAAFTARGANELPPLPWLGSDWLQVSLSWHHSSLWVYATIKDVW